MYCKTLGMMGVVVVVVATASVAASAATEIFVATGDNYTELWNSNNQKISDYPLYGMIEMDYDPVSDRLWTAKSNALLQRWDRSFNKDYQATFSGLAHISVMPGEDGVWWQRAGNDWVRGQADSGALTGLGTSLDAYDIAHNAYTPDLGVWVARTGGFMQLWDFERSSSGGRSKLAQLDQPVSTIDVDQANGSAWVIRTNGLVQCWDAVDMTSTNTDVTRLGAISLDFDDFGGAIAIEAIPGGGGVYVATGDGWVESYTMDGTHRSVTRHEFGTGNIVDICLDDATNDIWIATSDGKLRGYDMSGNQVGSTLDFGGRGILDIEVVPEPVTLTLLGVGGLALLRRRSC